MIENWIKIIDTKNYLNNDKDVNEKLLEFKLADYAIYPANDLISKMGSIKFI